MDSLLVLWPSGCFLISPWEWLCHLMQPKFWCKKSKRNRFRQVLHHVDSRMNAWINRCKMHLYSGLLSTQIMHSSNHSCHQTQQKYIFHNSFQLASDQKIHHKHSDRNGRLGVAHNWFCSSWAQPSSGGIARYNANHQGFWRYCLRNGIDPWSVDIVTPVTYLENWTHNAGAQEHICLPKSLITIGCPQVVKASPKRNTWPLQVHRVWFIWLIYLDM